MRRRGVSLMGPGAHPHREERDTPELAGEVRFELTIAVLETDALGHWATPLK